MIFNVVTIFPEQLNQLGGVIGQAQKKGAIQVETLNPREFTKDFHQSVDDKPFGGSDGMLMLAEPLAAALKKLRDNKRLGRVVYLSPQGRPWTDAQARQWAQIKEPMTLICGRYAGVDQRFINEHVDEEISIGDYVLSGGELAAQVLIDSTARFLPEVLGNAKSPEEESFSNGLLEAPQFTRPREVDGVEVPEVLLSGHHQKIEEWKINMSLLVTALRRPDLLGDKPLGPALKWAAGRSSKELEACGLSHDLLRGLAL